MNIKKTFIVVVVFVFSLGASAQSESSKWVVELGGSFVKFSENNTTFKDEGFNFQVPNVYMTRYVMKGFSVGGGFSASAFLRNESLFKNKFKILSFDGYIRYDFNKSNEVLVPYIIGGASYLIKEKAVRSISGNVGVGLTYWILPRLGFNIQVLHKYVPVKFKSVFPPHTQFSGGLVFAFGQRSSRKGFRRLGSGFCDY